MAKPEPQSEPTKILVVDDEDGIRQALDRFLTRLGYRVVQAANAAEALERQATETPELMLSDIRMPNMTGVELVPKALAHDPDLAIIMLTAIDEPRTAIECLKLGAYDYLIKPVDLDELELSLQGALRQRQLWRSAPGISKSTRRRSVKSPWTRSRPPTAGRESGRRWRSWRKPWAAPPTRSPPSSSSAAARPSGRALSPHTLCSV